jgi:hypothetical protein
MSCIDPKNKEAVAFAKVISDAIEKHGHDFVDRAFSEAMREPNREMFAEKYGVKLSGGQRDVIRLLGKRGQYGYMDHRPPGTDHESLWNKDGKPAVFVSQPYGLTWETLQELVEFCKAKGLAFEVDTGGWHFTTACLLVTFFNASQLKGEGFSRNMPRPGDARYF